MKHISLGESDDVEPEMTVPQILDTLHEIREQMAGDPCLDDLASVTADLIDQVLERCRLAAEIAAEARRERELH